MGILPSLSRMKKAVFFSSRRQMERERGTLLRSTLSLTLGGEGERGEGGKERK